MVERLRSNKVKDEFSARMFIMLTVPTTLATEDPAAPADPGEGGEGGENEGVGEGEGEEDGEEEG
jgi:hypothetical protein